jgi:hypothetical protein
MRRLARRFASDASSGKAPVQSRPDRERTVQWSGPTSTWPRQPSSSTRAATRRRRAQAPSGPASAQQTVACALLTRSSRSKVLRRRFGRRATGPSPTRSREVRANLPGARSDSRAVRQDRPKAAAKRCLLRKRARLPRSRRRLGIRPTTTAAPGRRSQATLLPELRPRPSSSA